MTAHKTIKFDFNPRFPRGKRQRGRRSGAGGPEFQSTLPAREATPGKRRLTNPGKYFNPRFPRGKRPLSGRSLSFLKIFQSTLPAGEATSSSRFCSSDLKISIHASREGSDQSAPHCTSSARNFNPRFPRGKRRREIIIMARNLISIHASREGSDLFILISPFYFFNFNPRFPRGKRLNVHSLLCTLGIFQSTLPAGEATRNLLDFARFLEISIHASRGGSDGIISPHPAAVGISIHASRGGSDGSSGRACAACRPISIHASRGGSDMRLLLHLMPDIDFNPRFPRGKRRLIDYYLHCTCNFNPRFPRGKRPDEFKKITGADYISIHASRGGSDLTAVYTLITPQYFNPRFPRGKRQYGQAVP